MTKSDEKEHSANIAMWYRDIPFTLDELANIEGKVTKECWKYLVGKICKNEREKRRDNERVCDIYEQMGNIFGYIHTSLKKVVNYTNAIDRIHRFLPNIAADILNGKIRISTIDTIVLAKLDFTEINDVILRLSNENTLAKIIIAEQKALRKKTKRPGRPKRIIDETPRVSIKDTPTYDPDAQINALAYTIPTWVSMVERTFTASDLNEISSNARKRLAEELKKLTVSVETAKTLLTEGM